MTLVFLNPDTFGFFASEVEKELLDLYLQLAFFKICQAENQILTKTRLIPPVLNVKVKGKNKLP